MKLRQKSPAEDRARLLLGKLTLPTSAAGGRHPRLPLLAAPIWRGESARGALTKSAQVSRTPGRARTDTQDPFRGLASSFGLRGRENRTPSCAHISRFPWNGSPCSLSAVIHTIPRHARRTRKGRSQVQQQVHQQILVHCYVKYAGDYNAASTVGEAAALRGPGGERDSRALPSGQAGVPASALEHRVEHLAGDPAGEGVLLARVVAAEHQQPGDLHLGSVAEARPRIRHADPARAQLTPDRLPGEMTEAHDGGNARGDQVEFGCQPRLARVPLLHAWLIAGRRAPDGGQHPDSEQALAISGRHAGRLRRQATPPQRSEQHITAAITGEDPASA